MQSLRQLPPLGAGTTTGTAMVTIVACNSQVHSTTTAALIFPKFETREASRKATETTEDASETKEEATETMVKASEIKVEVS